MNPVRNCGPTARFGRSGWGTISFDFISGEISVDKPFLFDAYENEVIKFIQSTPVSNIPKEAIVPFI